MKKKISTFIEGTKCEYYKSMHCLVQFCCFVYLLAFASRLDSFLNVILVIWIGCSDYNSFWDFKKIFTYFILYTKLIIDINYLIRFRLKLTNDCGFIIFNLIHELFERWSLTIIFKQFKLESMNNSLLENFFFFK